MTPATLRPVRWLGMGQHSAWTSTAEVVNSCSGCRHYGHVAMTGEARCLLAPGINCRKHTFALSLVRSSSTRKPGPPPSLAAFRPPRSLLFELHPISALPAEFVEHYHRARPTIGLEVYSTSTPGPRDRVDAGWCTAQARRRRLIGLEHSVLDMEPLPRQ